ELPRGRRGAAPDKRTDAPPRQDARPTVLPGIEEPLAGLVLAGLQQKQTAASPPRRRHLPAAHKIRLSCDPNGLPGLPSVEHRQGSCSVVVASRSRMGMQIRIRSRSKAGLRHSISTLKHSASALSPITSTAVPPLIVVKALREFARHERHSLLFACVRGSPSQTNTNDAPVASGAYAR